MFTQSLAKQHWDLQIPILLTVLPSSDNGDRKNAYVNTVRRLVGMSQSARPPITSLSSPLLLPLRFCTQIFSSLFTPVLAALGIV